jgi:hypothetical protein
MSVPGTRLAPYLILRVLTLQKRMQHVISQNAVRPYGGRDC